MVPPESDNVNAGAGLPTSVLTSIATFEPSSGPGMSAVPLFPSPAGDSRNSTQAPNAITTATTAIPTATTGARRGADVARLRRARWRTLIFRPQGWETGQAPSDAGSVAVGTADVPVTTG